MTKNPSVLIVSSSNIKPKSIIKLITGCTDNEIEENEPEKVSYTWTIDTKYYTANVDLFGITERYKRTEDFNSNVEALIIHFDTNKDNGLDNLKVWKDIEDDCEPEVKLLISNYCSNETKITNAKAVEWCLKNSFELIELYPNKKQYTQDDIIKEKVGVKRIIEALQTHVWSNLCMKEKDCEKNTKETKHEASIKSCQADDDFTELFQQMHMMKESIQSMPSSQRKQYAEQIVTAFWRAIGGDEEEIADLE